MTTTTPGLDDDDETMIDLVEDCREVSGMLAPFVLDLTTIPAARGALPVEIDARTAASIEGYGSYGS